MKVSLKTEQRRRHTTGLHREIESRSQQTLLRLIGLEAEAGGPS